MSEWTCHSCGNVYGADAPESCPECGSDKISFIQEGVETVAPREISMLARDDSAAESDPEAGRLGRLPGREVLANPTVQWLVFSGVVLGGIGLAIGFGFIDLSALLGGGTAGTVGITSDCDTDNATSVSCLHTLEPRDASVTNGTFIVQYVVDEGVVHERRFSIDAIPEDETHTFQTHLSGSPRAIADYELQYHLEGLDWG